MISKLCFTILTVNSFLPERQHQEITTYFLDEMLNNRTLSLTEAFGGIPSSGVGEILGILLLHGNVVLEGHVRHLHVLTGPLPEKLDLRQLRHHCRWLLNVVHRDFFISPVVTHFDLSCRSESSNKSL